MAYDVSTKKNVRISDLNPEMGSPGQPSLLFGERAVRMSLKNLLSSFRGDRSRTFNTSWGCNVLEHLQEPGSDTMAMLIKSSIVDAIREHDSRVEVVNSATTVTMRSDGQAYDVFLAYRISGSDQILSYQLTLEK